MPVRLAASRPQREGRRRLTANPTPPALARWPAAQGATLTVAVVKMLWEERAGPLYKQLEHHYDSPALWTAAIAEHRAVLKSVAAHDIPGARAAMQRHLNRAYKRFYTGWDALH